MGMAAAPIMGMQAAGGLISAYGNYQAGMGNAAIDHMNAGYDRQAAQYAMQKGEWQAGQADIKGGLIAGMQAASYAGQGVVAGAGSAATTVQSSAAVSAAEKAMIRLNASREAYGYEVAASSADFQARMARRGAYFGAAGSILGAGGQAAFTGAMLGG